MIEQLTLDMKDNTVVKWAIEQIMYAFEEDEKKGYELSEKFLSDKFIEEIISNNEELLLSGLFISLPSKRFKNNLEKMAEKWPLWHGTIALKSAIAIAEGDPIKAYSLFENYLSSDVDPHEDRYKMFGVFESLKYLDREQAKKLSFKVIDDYINSSLPDYEKLDRMSLILRAAWDYDHSEFLNLLRQWFSLMDDIEYGREFISDLTAFLIKSESDFEFICSYCYDDSEEDYKKFSLFFKTHDITKEINKVIKDIKKGKYEKVYSLFNKYIDNITDERLKNLLHSLLNDKNFTDELDENFKGLFYIFILSSLIAFMRSDNINLDGMKINEVIDLLTTDLEEVPSFDKFISYLQKENKNSVIKALSDKLDVSKDLYFYPSHIVKIMGELHYSEFIEPLFKFLSSQEDKMAEAVDGLLEYKDELYEYIVNKFEDMDSFEKLTACFFMERLDKNKIPEFLDKYLNKLWVGDKEIVLAIMRRFPEEKYIDILEPHINKDQTAIDITYVLFCKLFNIEKPEIENLKKNIAEKEKEEEEAHKAYHEENYKEYLKDYIDLELSCDNCSHENFYRIKDIKVDFAGNDSFDVTVNDDISCINCGENSGYKITQQSFGTLFNRISVLMDLEDDNLRKELIERGPVRFAKDKDLSKEEIEEILLSMVDDEPDEADHYIRLGHFYKHNDKTKDAEKYYKKALKIDPSYSEVYYALADIAFLKEKYKTACELLEKGKPYLHKGSYREDFEDMEGFFKIYDDFHHKMLHKVSDEKSEKTRVKAVKHEGCSCGHHHHGHDELPVKEPVKSEEKAKRNEPCPCGSGKKYKKCCLNK